MSARLKGVGMEDEFAVTAAFRDGCQVLTTSGELDIHTAPKLRAALDGDVDGLPVIVDLTALTFIDSSGLHTLLRNHQDGRLAALVSAPDSNVQRVLDLKALTLSGLWPDWVGLLPDDSPSLMLDRSTEEIDRLDLQYR